MGLGLSSGENHSQNGPKLTRRHTIKKYLASYFSLPEVDDQSSMGSGLRASINENYFPIINSSAYEGDISDEPYGETPDRIDLQLLENQLFLPFNAPESPYPLGTHLPESPIRFSGFPVSSGSLCEPRTPTALPEPMVTIVGLDLPFVETGMVNDNDLSSFQSFEGSDPNQSSSENLPISFYKSGERSRSFLQLTLDPYAQNPPKSCSLRKPISKTELKRLNSSFSIKIDWPESFLKFNLIEPNIINSHHSEISIPNSYSTRYLETDSGSINCVHSAPNFPVFEKVSQSRRAQSWNGVSVNHSNPRNLSVDDNQVKSWIFKGKLQELQDDERDLKEFIKTNILLNQKWTQILQDNDQDLETKLLNLQWFDYYISPPRVPDPDLSPFLRQFEDLELFEF